MAGFAQSASIVLGGTSALRASSVLVYHASGADHDSDVAVFVLIFSLCKSFEDRTYTMPVNRMKRPGTQEPAESQLVSDISLQCVIVDLGVKYLYIIIVIIAREMFTPMRIVDSTR
jgi:hypothetical protein